MNTPKRLVLSCNELARLVGKDSHTVSKLLKSEPALGGRKLGRTWCIPVAKVAAFFGLELEDVQDALG